MSKKNCICLTKYICRKIRCGQKRAQSRGHKANKWKKKYIFDPDEAVPL